MDELEDFETFLIDELRFSPGTVKLTMSKIRYVSKRCDINDRIAIQGFIRSVWQSRGNKTADGYIRILNRWSKFKRFPPFKYFRQYGTFGIKYCTPEEKAKLMETAARKGIREKAMFSVLFGCGLRLKEACDLKISNIFQDTIKVLGKGQKERLIYLPAETRQALMDYLQVRTPEKYLEDRDYVFTTKYENKMSYDFFRKICEDIGKIAGVKFHPHMARHTYATELLKAGVDIYYVARLLGHEDLSSTEIYLHPTQDDAINALRKLKEQTVQNSVGLNGVDSRGFEPLPSSMPRKRSTADL